MKICCSLIAAACLLASCATDKGYSTLAATAEKNPSKDVIVGMWHRKWSDGMGLHHQVSILVKPDGTGLESFHGAGWAIGGTHENVKPFKWEYFGNGVWKMNYYQHNLVYTCSYSNGKLLRYTDDLSLQGRLGRVSNVFERVSQ
jgi:hypothetical protein